MFTETRAPRPFASLAACGISETSWQAWLEPALDAVIVMDQHGRVMALNPAAEAMFGYSSMEALGREVAELIVPPALRERHRQGLARFRERGEAAILGKRLEMPALHADGSELTVELTVSRLLFTGEPIFVAYLRDITERIAATRRFVETQERLHLALRAARMVAWDWDLLADEIVRSENAECGLGLPARQTGTEFMAAVYPEDRPAVEAAMKRALTGEAPFDEEFRLVRPDGEIRWVRRRAEVALQRGGRPVRMAGICADVTEHKHTAEALRLWDRRLQEELRREKEYTEHIVAAAPTLICGIAPNGTTTFVNEAVRRVTGYSAAELVGQNWWRTFYPGDEYRQVEQLFQDFEQGQVVNYEMTLTTRQGEKRVISWNSVNRFGPHGELVEVIGIGADVTERWLAESRLRAFTAELERRNRDLQEFAYVASHDLQEPLRKIEMFAELLGEEPAAALSDTGRDYLERMQSAARRMRTLVVDLLTLSRLSTQNQPFALVDLGEVAAEVVSDLEARIEQTGGVVTVGPLPALEADRTQIRQLLQNLIGNGLKFHRAEEPPRVRVECQLLSPRLATVPAGSPGPLWYHLTVQDNGIGFDTQYADRIFQPFQRLHGRAHYEGTGIGLAICRKIAERHGGSITVQSAPGEGATFTVALPARQPEGE